MLSLRFLFSLCSLCPLWLNKILPRPRTLFTRAGLAWRDNSYPRLRPSQALTASGGTIGLSRLSAANSLTDVSAAKSSRVMNCRCIAIIETFC